MDFFDKLGETITAKSKDVAKKAKEIAEVVNLNSKISTQEEIIKKTYLEIGQKYYEKYKDDISNEFSLSCEIITDSLTEIAKIKSEIQAIKNYKVCSKCGAEIDAEAAFCSKCGVQFEVDGVEPEGSSDSQAHDVETEDIFNSFDEKEVEVIHFETKYENEENK